MSDDQSAVAAAEVSVIHKTIREVTRPFIDLVHASRALWGINLSYVLEGLTYFGVVGLLAIYFDDYVGLNDIDAGQMVGFQTAGITLAMFFLGATVDILGARKALLISLSVMLIGRTLLAAAPALSSTQGLWSSVHLTAMGGMLGVVIGYGIYQPACYAAVKFFTTEKTAAMGYAMLYALMNLGAFLPGLISPPVRRAFGITGVFWVYVALTAVGILCVAIILTKKAMRDAMATTGRSDKKQEAAEEKKLLKDQIRFYITHFPIRDRRFLYLIFILIPVRTFSAQLVDTSPVHWGSGWLAVG
jgi:POT family proton-dependent oligopeptide transporter